MTATVDSARLARPHGRALAHVIVGALAMLVAALVLCARPAISAAACGNPIACENEKTGTPSSQWLVDTPGDSTIQGFATQMSVNAGQTVNFKIKLASTTATYRIDIVRLGYYNGDGGRIVAPNIAHSGPTSQPACLNDAATTNTGLIDCGNWSVSASWAVPSDAVSGVYLAHLKRNDTGGASNIIFVVRDDSGDSDIVVETSDATWQAYNVYGGNSLYQCTVNCPPGSPKAYKAAFKVSYNRPLDLSTDPGTELFTGAEYSMIRFLEEQGYDVSYVSAQDVLQHGANLLDHKAFVSSGHSEYWSATERNNVEAARDAGVNLAWFTGNEVFWKTRWEPSLDATHTADRTLVAYKDTHFDAPTDPVEWTGSWRDPRFTSASQNPPENALTGQLFVTNSGTAEITVGSQYKNLRLWRNTDVASLIGTNKVTLGQSTLGYEWDVDADDGYRPAGTFDVSSTTVTGVQAFTDYGSTTANNSTVTHNLTLYRAPSGALVFGAGTVQWAWGLNDWNNTSGDENMQQATVNLFADMGAQPTTMVAGLHSATKSTDTIAPHSTITAPGSQTDGTRITLSGTASDTGGGVVAGVEISTDGGSTWHPATGTTSWTYSWVVHSSPSTVIKTRAVDDSGNLETPGAGVTVNVSCPCSIWGTNVTPPVSDSGEPQAVELGVKFRSSTYGSVSAIRFYKSAANTGTHIGSLWTTDGTRLAQAMFQNETASGWQTVTFDTPVPIMPNTTYVASYYAPNGHFAVTSSYFYRNPAPAPSGGAATLASPLEAVPSSGSSGNGMYTYGPTTAFPANSYDASNYWVDVRFTQVPAPGQVTSVSAVSAGLTSAAVSWTAPATGGAPTTYTVTPYIGSTPQTPKIVTGTPLATSTTVTGLTNGVTYTFKVTASNPNGSGIASAASNAVTPLNPVAPTVPQSVAALAASQSARVTWTAPASDGDSSITGYTITPYIGASAQPALAVGANGSATSVTVPGLTNGIDYTFKVLATNGVGDGPSSPATTTVTPAASLFELTEPVGPDSGDNSPVEVGVKFTADANGSITGIRFYKQSANTGTHIGSLWSSTGTLLGRATFTNESATGWQTVKFASPVSITAGTTYVASYYAPGGHYSGTSAGLASGRDNGALHAIAGSNGVYSYGSSPTFPTSSYNNSNYWVDVTYALPAPGQPTGVAATEGGTTSANVTWSAPASGGAVSSYKVTPYIGATAQTPVTVSGTPLNTSVRITGLTTGTTYSFTVQALNANGGGTVSSHSNTVTPTGPVLASAPTNLTTVPATQSVRVSWTTPTSDGDSAISGYTITPYIGATAQTPVTASAGATSKTVTGLLNGTSYTFKVSATNGVGTGLASAASAATVPQATILEYGTPASIDDGDNNAVNLGVKFKADYNGTVSGVRFYKSAANTGTHIGALWTAGGTKLSQATFTNETATGWQTVTFPAPISVTAGTTYVASYLAPNGHYSATGGGLLGGFDNAPLHAIANSTSANGVFSYGSAVAFPTSSWNGANYWVDVLYMVPVPGTVATPTAESGEHDVGRRDVDAARRRPGVVLRRDAVHRHHCAGGQDRQRLGHEHHSDRADDRPDVHVHGPRIERQRVRQPVGEVELGHAERRRAAVGAVERGRAAGGRERAGELVGAGQRRRQPDHRLHRHAAHRGDVAGADPGWCLGDERYGARVDQRRVLHVRRDRDERDRHGLAVLAVRRGRPERHAVRLPGAGEPG